jgi:hypothetical protein
MGVYVQWHALVHDISHTAKPPCVNLQACRIAAYALMRRGSLNRAEREMLKALEEVRKLAVELGSLSRRNSGRQFMDIDVEKNVRDTKVVDEAEGLIFQLTVDLAKANRRQGKEELAVRPSVCLCAPRIA